MAELRLIKRGKVWQYIFESAQIKGKRQRISKCGFRTKAEAAEAGAKALAEYNEAGLRFVPSETSYSDFLDYWMDTYGKMNFKEVTTEDYEKKIRLYIKPALGKYKLKALSSPVLQQFINNMAKQNFSRNTLSVVKGILSKSFKYAVLQEMIRYSPMGNVSLPSPRNEKLKPRTAPHVYIPPDKITAIFERFPEGTSTHIPMMFGYKCGMRLGEAFAVTWEDVLFERNQVKVTKQIQYSQADKVWYFSNPKYESSRTIDVDLEFMELLKREKQKQERARDYYAEHYTVLYENDRRQIHTAGDGKVIHPVAVRENGELINSNNMQHTSRIVHYEMGFPEFDFHSFRHTHATMLAEKNVPPKYLQQRLGHKDLQVTMKYYLHLTERMNDEGAAIINSLYQDDTGHKK